MSKTKRTSIEVQGAAITIVTQGSQDFISLTPRKWIEATAAIGFQSRAGRYGGGTYAHKDIAFEFGSWLTIRPTMSLHRRTLAA